MYICKYIYIYIYIYIPLCIPTTVRSFPTAGSIAAAGRGPAHYIYREIFERSRSKSSPLEKIRSKLANPVELSWGFDRGC